MIIVALDLFNHLKTEKCHHPAKAIFQLSVLSHFSYYSVMQTCTQMKFV